jgi:Na+-transporting methylmalonyl-CoA/oxaloacetate decarboxylase beta subunit
MDMLAFFGAFLGVTLASQGYLLVGSVVLAGPLVLLAVLINRPKKPLLLLPFSFTSWYVALPLGLLATIAFKSPFFLGLAMYYLGALHGWNARCGITHGDP